MFARLKGLFAPPVFEDEEKTRVANLLYVVLLTTLLLSVMFVLAVPIISPSPVFSWVATSMLMLPQLGALWLAHRGRVQLASVLFSLMLWLIVTLSAIFAGGVRSTSANIYTLVILIAGLLLGWRAGLAFIGSSVVAGLGMLHAEKNGVLPIPLISNTSTSIFAVQTASFSAAAALLYLAIRDVNDALRRARRNERALAETNRELEIEIAERVHAEEALRERAARMELIGRVGQRTTAILDKSELLRQAVDLIADTFDYYNVAILLVDGSEIVLEAGTLPEVRRLEGRVRLRIGSQGITGWVAGSGEPLLVPDVSLDARYHPVLRETRVRSELAVPVILKEKIIGVLDVQSVELGAFSQTDLFTLQTVADQLAVAIENAHLYEEIRRRAERLAVVNRIARVVGTVLNLDVLMENVYQEVTPIFQADAFFIALYDKETDELDFRIQVDEGVREPRLREPLGTGLTSLVVARREPLLIRDLEQEQDRLPSPELWGTMKPPASWLGVPMQIGERLMGVICVQAYRRHAYGVEEQLLLSTIADQVAVAVERARLYEAVQHELAERKRVEAELVQAQKMEAIGRLAGGVAHDFNNLLTAITGYTDLLLDDFSPGDPARADLQEIKRAADRAASLTDQLLAFSRRKMLQPKVLNLNTVVTDVENMLRRLIGEDIDLVTALSPTVGRVKADLGQIQQVIMNLAVNARDAMPRGGKLTVETANVELDEAYARQHVDAQPGAYVMLAVSDTGVGMDRETQEHLFEPFFTTKETGRGTGLGLATAHGIVKQSGGSIYVYSEPDQGTTFKIYLPRIKETAELLRPEAAYIGWPQGPETVLLVEDEDIVRELARRVLQRSGYTVLEARQAEEAIRVCEQHKEPIHLVLTDVVMPGGMSGRDLAERLVGSRPEMRVLYTSGYTDNAIVHHGVLDEEVAFLQKPFTPDALARKVREVLDTPAVQ